MLPNPHICAGTERTETETGHDSASASGLRALRCLPNKRSPLSDSAEPLLRSASAARASPRSAAPCSAVVSHHAPPPAVCATIQLRGERGGLQSLDEEEEEADSAACARLCSPASSVLATSATRTAACVWHSPRRRHIRTAPHARTRMHRRRSYGSSPSTRGRSCFATWSTAPATRLFL